MLRAGKAIHTAKLNQSFGRFRERVGYLSAIADYLQNGCDSNMNLPLKKLNGFKNIWLANSANLDPSAEIYGPVVIMDEAVISKEAVIFGPAIIGRGVNIGNNSLIENSVLWDNSKVGKNCEIRRCIIDCQAVVPNNTVANKKSILFRPDGILKTSVSCIPNFVKNKTSKLFIRGK